MVERGLKADASEAEQTLFHKVREWAQEAGLAMTSVKPEGAAVESGLGVSTFSAAGTGPMRAVARFLWHVENADVPLKILDMRLGARKAGADDLSIRLHLATVYVAAEEAAPVKAKK